MNSSPPQYLPWPPALRGLGLTTANLRRHPLLPLAALPRSLSMNRYRLLACGLCPGSLLSSCCPVYGSKGGRATLSHVVVVQPSASSDRCRYDENDSTVASALLFLASSACLYTMGYDRSTPRSRNVICPCRRTGGPENGCHLQQARGH